MLSALTVASKAAMQISLKEDIARYDGYVGSD